MLLLGIQGSGLPVRCANKVSIHLTTRESALVCIPMTAASARAGDPNNCWTLITAFTAHTSYFDCDASDNSFFIGFMTLYLYFLAVCMIVLLC